MSDRRSLAPKVNAAWAALDADERAIAEGILVRRIRDAETGCQVVAALRAAGLEINICCDHCDV